MIAVEEAGSIGHKLIYETGQEFEVLELYRCTHDSVKGSLDPASWSRVASLSLAILQLQNKLELFYDLHHAAPDSDNGGRAGSAATMDLIRSKSRSGAVAS